MADVQEEVASLKRIANFGKVFVEEEVSKKQKLKDSYAFIQNNTPQSIQWTTSTSTTATINTTWPGTWNQ